MRKEIDPAMGNVYRFRTAEEEAEALELIKDIVSPYNLSAEMLSSNIMARGTQGDEPTYTRVILLKGVYLDDKILEDVSTKITNIIPVNTVLIEIL